MPSLSELNHPLRGNIILDTTDSKTWSEDAQSHPGLVFRDHAVHRFTERTELSGLKLMRQILDLISLFEFEFSTLLVSV